MPYLLVLLLCLVLFFWVDRLLLVSEQWNEQYREAWGFIITGSRVIPLFKSSKCCDTVICYLWYCLIIALLIVVSIVNYILDIFFPKAILVEQRENMKSCDNGMLKYEKNTKEDQEKMSKSFSVSARTPAGRNDTQKRSNWMMSKEENIYKFM